MTTQLVNFSLNPEADADILQWLEEQPNKSQAIREAIRARMERMAQKNDMTPMDLLREIRKLLNELRADMPRASAPKSE